jgi:hypothetical protein
MRLESIPYLVWPRFSLALAGHVFEGISGYGLFSQSFSFIVFLIIFDGNFRGNFRSRVSVQYRRLV